MNDNAEHGKYNCLMKRGVLFLLMITFFIFQGCIGSSKPKPLVENYLLDYPAPVWEKQESLAQTIRFNRFNIATAYNTQNMVFREAGYGFDAFNYNRWAVNPADMIADNLLRDLRASGCFLAVFSRYETDEGRFILQGGIEEFFLRLDKNDKWAIISLDIILIDSRERNPSKRIVLQRKYYRSEPLKDPSPRGYCQAMSEALQYISRQITTDVQSAVKAAAK
jgi:ABC-type uncharacterized transport system auxiliary subunit